MKYSIIVMVVGLAVVLVVGAPGTRASGPVDQATAPASISSPRASGQPPAQPVGCSQSPANPPISETYDLDEDAADWGVYCEGSPTWLKENVATPSIDRKSLRCSVTGGAPYSNVHCYRNLPPEPTAAVFTLALSFRFTPTTCNNQDAPSIVQALEFAMNIWRQRKRYEFALQWQNVGDGAPQWRYWDPHRPERWIPVRPTITQCLQGERWHSLTLEGEIIDGQVHYRRFTIDQQSHILDISVPPLDTSGEADRLAIAIQLDGNSKETPYDVFVDKVSFTRSTTQICFRETGQCISGRFREYWEQNGGLAVFGFPVTPPWNEENRDTGQTYLTQWFERNRFESHPENAPPYDVLLGRLGNDRLRQKGIDWRTLPRESGPKAGCRWFEQTGHNICDQGAGLGFKTYWQTHGLSDPRLNAYERSLALFGLPLTEPRMETNTSGDTVLTQWFERARFEWHPNQPDQYKVLLGLLGNEVRTNQQR